MDDREHRLLQMMADGMSSKQIARELFLSEGTVKNLRSELLDRFGVRNGFQLVAVALRQGLIA